MGNLKKEKSWKNGNFKTPSAAGFLTVLAKFLFF